jgi:hypothetical protein
LRSVGELLERYSAAPVALEAKLRGLAPQQLSSAVRLREVLAEKGLTAGALKQ